VLAFDPDGGVHSLMPAIQFGATYHVDGDRVVLRGSIRDWIDTSFRLQHDTLLTSTTAPGSTLAGNWHRSPAGSRGMPSTWQRVNLGASGMEAFMTLRSDSKVVLETGYPVQATFRGDTLTLLLPVDQFPPDSRKMTLVIYLTGDTLRATESGGPTRLMVRKPWGCFALASFDQDARECH
jgi:hypothetical protein